jgi:hypothetical protein
MTTHPGYTPALSRICPSYILTPPPMLEFPGNGSPDRLTISKTIA